MTHGDFVTAVTALGFTDVTAVTIESGTARLTMTGEDGHKWKYRCVTAVESDALDVFAQWVVEDIASGRRGRIAV